MSDQESSGGMMHQPGAEMDRLKPFIGTFAAQVKLWMGPGEPMVSTGTMVNEVDLGGLFLRQDYNGDPSPGPFGNFAGRGFWGYNQTVKRYEGFWIDNASSIMQFESGELDDSGKVWTMHGSMPDPQTGDTMTKRSVITVQDDDHHKIEMYFSKAGQEFKGMEIEYVRKS